MTKATTTPKQPERARAIQSHLEKIVINAGVGRASQQANFAEKILPQILRDIGLIAGQRAQVRGAKKSIAGFKIREGQTVGVRVTLRGKRLVDFFERLVTMVLPRVRDFHGVDLRNIDSAGALNVGFREQLVFPEVDAEESFFVFPLGVNIVPRVKDRGAAISLYRNLGVPLKK